MYGNNVQNDGCIRQKAVEDTKSDKCRTKTSNIRRGSRERLVENVANVFSHENWALKLLWLWYFPILKRRILCHMKLSITRIEHNQSHLYVQSKCLASEFLKKASSVALTWRWLELKQIICLMLQDIFTKHGIYTWTKLFEGKLSLTYFSFIKMNKRNIIVS